MRIKKQFIWICILIFVLVCVSYVNAVGTATRNFPTKTDNNAVTYVCEDAPFSVTVGWSGTPGSGYTFIDNVPSGGANPWRYTTYSSNPVGLCSLSGSPLDQSSCSQTAPGNTITFNVDNTGAGDVIGPGRQSGVFSGTFTYTGQGPAAIGGINQIYVKSRLCRPDDDRDNYTRYVPPNIDCYCASNTVADCDDNPTDDGTQYTAAQRTQIDTDSDNNVAEHVHPGATDYCENGVDEDCSGSDAPCASRLVRGTLGTYEVGLPFVINFTMAGALSENSLVADEQYDSNRFRFLSASNKGNGSHAGHVKWIISNPKPSLIPNSLLTYTIESKGTCPESAPTQFGGQYHYSGRSVENIGADNIVPITNEALCDRPNVLGAGTNPCCGDGFDNDCDGSADCSDPDCAGGGSLGGTVCCTLDSHCTGQLLGGGSTYDCAVEFCNTTLGLCDLQSGNTMCSNDEICNATYSCIDACLGQCGYNYTQCVPIYGAPPGGLCTPHVCYGDCSGSSGGNNTMGGYSC